MLHTHFTSPPHTIHTYTSDTLFIQFTQSLHKLYPIQRMLADRHHLRCHLSRATSQPIPSSPHPFERPCALLPALLQPIATFRLQVLVDSSISCTPVRGTRLEGVSLLCGQWISFNLTLCDAFGNVTAHRRTTSATPQASCPACSEAPLVRCLQPGLWEVR